MKHRRLIAATLAASLLLSLSVQQSSARTGTRATAVSDSLLTQSVLDQPAPTSSVTEGADGQRLAQALAEARSSTATSSLDRNTTASDAVDPLAYLRRLAKESRNAVERGEAGFVERDGQIVYQQERPTEAQLSLALNPDPDVRERLTTATNPVLTATPSSITPNSTTATISGTVRASGTALSGVTVTVEYEGIWFEILPTATTNASGQYTVTVDPGSVGVGLPSSGWRVRFSKSGYVTEYFDDSFSANGGYQFSIAGGEAYTGVNADLGIAGSVSGTVSRADSEPMESVQVTIVSRGVVVSETTTGAFGFTGLPAADYVLCASPADYESVLRTTCWNSGGATPSPYISLSAGSSLTGRNIAIEKLSSSLPPGTVSGTVTAAGVGPVEGIQVFFSTFTYEWAPELSATTGADGTYTINLPPGSYSVRFGTGLPESTYATEYSGNTYNYWEATNITVTSATTTSGVDAVLTRSGTISGTVTDTSSAPIEGAQVCALEASNPKSGIYPCTSTDGNGDWSLTLGQTNTVATGFLYKFIAVKTGYRTTYLGGASLPAAASTVDMSPGAAHVEQDFVLADATGYVLGGMVYGSEGALSGARVDVGVAWQTYPGEYQLIPIASTFTDEFGVYSFTGLSAGPYVMQFSSDGLWTEFHDNKPELSSATPVTLQSATDTVIDATLGTGGAVSGTVTPGGAAIALCSRNNGWCFDTLANEDGTYAFTSIPAGQYTVAFSAPGYLAEYYDDTVRYSEAKAVPVVLDSTTSNIDAALSPGATITGRVTGTSNNPIEGATVVLAMAGSGVTTSTDADGRYTIAGIGKGSYWIYAEAPGMATTYWSASGSVGTQTAATPIAITGTPSLTRDLIMGAAAAETGAITGVVTAPLGGQVRLTLTGGVFGTSTWDYPDQTVLSGATYTFSNLPPGTYFLCAWATGAETSCVSSIPVDGSTITKNIALSRQNTITGIVLAADGRPLRDGQISFCSLDQAAYCPMEPFYLQTTEIVNGTYRITGLPAGIYVVYARSENPSDGAGEFLGDTITHDTATHVTISSGSTAVPAIALDHRETGSLSGRLVDSTGAPLRGIRVYARSPYSYLWNYEQRGETDANGEYVLNGLADAPHQLDFGGWPSTSTERPPSQGYRFDSAGTNTPSLVRPVPGSVTTGLDAELWPWATVSGTAVQPDGTPFTAGMVCFTSAFFLTPTCTDLDTDGLWSAKLEPRVSYRVAALPSDVNPDVTWMVGMDIGTVPHGGLSGIEVTSTHLASISGKVSLAGGPAEAMTSVVAVRADNYMWFVTDLVNIGATGSTYEFAAIPPGDYFVFARGSDRFTALGNYADPTPAPGSDPTLVRVGNGAAAVDIDIQQLRSSTVRVRVRTSGSNAAVSDAFVVANGFAGVTLSSGVTPPLLPYTSLIPCGPSAPQRLPATCAPTEISSSIEPRLASTTPTTFKVWRSAADLAAGAEHVASTTVTVTPGTSTTVDVSIPVASTPGAPRNLAATPDIGAVSLVWDAPSSNGGSSVTGYEISVNPPLPNGDGGAGRELTSTGTSLEVVGLLNASRYEFSVRAVNNIGHGPRSRSVSAIPTGCLGTPFTDVPADAPNCEELDFAYSLGLITVPDNGEFGGSEPVELQELVALFEELRNYLFGSAVPQSVGSSTAVTVAPAAVTTTAATSSAETLTRAVFAQALFEFAGEPTSPLSVACGVTAVSGPFTDVPKTHPNCRAIEWLKQLALTDGWATGTFGPDVTLTREVATTVVFRYQNEPTATVAPTTPPSAPAAPTGAEAVAGVESATVNWDAPTSNGGATILGYVVTSSPGGKTCSATTTLSCTVAGLTGGVSYTFAVRATNIAGTGTVSANSNSITAIAPAPETHTLGVSRSGAGSGAITSNPAGISCGATCTFAFTKSSSVTLTATPAEGSVFTGWSGDCSGTGACSVTMSAARSVTAGFEPVVTVIPGNGSAKITWRTDAWPTVTGVTGYQIERSADNGLTWKRVGSARKTATTFTAKGLKNGTSYTFRVRASRPILPGSWFQTTTVIPRTVPGQPKSIKVVGADTVLNVSWTPPTSTGGMPILEYHLQTSLNGRLWSAPVILGPDVRNHTYSGLTNGVKMFVRVSAVNVAGSSKSRQSGRVAPRLVAASAPRSLALSIVGGQVKATWATVADDGGSPVTDYEVWFSTNNRTWTQFTDGASTSMNATTSGLAAGTRYWIRVRAVTKFGPGKWTGAKAIKTPAAVAP